MMFFRYLFLIVLFFGLIVQNQVLTPTSFCLGNCTTCDHFSLTKCLLPYPCDSNFYSQKADGICLQAPSTELVSHQLFQNNFKVVQNLSKGWSQSKKQSHCEYASSEGKKYIEILGLYSGVQVLQRTFQINPLSDSFELTFDLILGEWVPFSDFLIIDIMSKDDNLLSLEISFDTSVTVNSQAAIITCNGVRVMTKKYSFKFANNNRVNNKLTAVFTGFLFNSFWGLTNVRLHQGCLGYSLFNHKTYKCSKCDNDSYLISKQTADWCEKCPLLCKTCQSKTKCLTCVQGASLNKSGLCDFGEKYKTQLAQLGEVSGSCDGQIKMGSVSGKIALSVLNNDEELAYDEVQVGFMLYYFPNSWKSSTKNYISVKLNKVQVMRLDYRNLTNFGVNRCLAFKQKRAAKIEIFSGKIPHNDSSASLELEMIGNEKGIQFGVGSVRVKSLIKYKPIIVAKPVNSPTAKPFFINSTIAMPTISNTSPNISKTIIEPIKNSSTQPKSQLTPDVLVVPILVTQNKINKPENLSNTSSKADLPPQPQSPAFSNTSETNDKEKPEVHEKIQVGKYLQDLLTRAQQSSNISFISSRVDDCSGLRIYVKGQISNQNIVYKAYIDKLDSSSYELTSSTFQDGKIILFIRIAESFIDGNIAIYSITSSRLLTQTAPQLVANFKVKRFDAFSSSQISSLQGFSYVFSAAAWIAVVLIFISVILGYGVTVQELVISLQVLFMHIYIGSQYLPLTFRDVIGGLSIVQNLNFFAPVHKQSIQSWLGTSSRNIPVRFQLYNSNIVFLRQFYPVIIINLIYLFWFICLVYARKHFINGIIIEQKKTYQKVIDNIVSRTINFFDQIWRYQFLSTMWFCFIQFYDISSPNRCAVINGFICVLAFICSISWPIFVTFYCTRQYYQCEYSEYLYFYQDIYYGKIPQYQLPSQHHRVGYPSFRTAKLFFIALAVCYFSNVPIFALYSLIIVQVGEICYTRYCEVYIDKKYWIIRVVQNGLFVILQLVTAVMLACDKSVSSNVYKAMGYFLSGIGLLVVINSAVRMSYLVSKKVKEIAVSSLDLVYEEKKPQTQRIV